MKINVAQLAASTFPRSSIIILALYIPSENLKKKKKKKKKGRKKKRRKLPL